MEVQDLKRIGWALTLELRLVTSIAAAGSPPKQAEEELPETPAHVKELHASDGLLFSPSEVPPSVLSD